MDRSHKDFLSVLGHCFLRHGRFGDARTVFEAMAVLFPGDVLVMASLSYALLQQGDPDGALASTDTLLRLALTERDRSYAQLIRGRALLALGRVEEARLSSANLHGLTHEH